MKKFPPAIVTVVGPHHDEYVAGYLPFLATLGQKGFSMPER
jgi:hypothetical protein